MAHKTKEKQMWSQSSIRFDILDKLHGPEAVIWCGAG